MLCVWLLLNPISIHVTFTAIVPGAYPGEAKMCKNVLKWRTFELTVWITGKRLKIDGYMLRCVWQALNPLFTHVTFIAIVPGPLGWLQKLTHVLLAIAILLVHNNWSATSHQHIATIIAIGSRAAHITVPTRQFIVLCMQQNQPSGFSSFCRLTCADDKPGIIALRQRRKSQRGQTRGTTAAASDRSNCTY